MEIETFETQSDGLKIYGNIHLPQGRPAPCIICSHGLFSSKESPKFIAIARSLAAGGFVSVRYDHRGCGISEGAIEETTISGRIQDLCAIYDKLRGHPAVNGVFGLMGSSMGGYITLLTAGRLEAGALAIWSTPFTIGWKKTNETDTPLPVLNDGFHEDLKRHRLQGIFGGGSAGLVIHGQYDEMVPLWHALTIYGALNGPKALEILPGADHRISVDTSRNAAIRRSVRFFRDKLL